LEEFGYKVVVINNGKDALRFLAGENILKIKKDDLGLILVDLEMEGISGFEILKEIRNSKIQIPVAVLSVGDDKDDAKEAKKLGAQDYFVKGKDEKELERLRNFIIKACAKNK
jgi:CheY-like chemotaxis protein